VGDVAEKPLAEFAKAFGETDVRHLYVIKQFFEPGTTLDQRFMRNRAALFEEQVKDNIDDGRTSAKRLSTIRIARNDALHDRGKRGAGRSLAGRRPDKFIW
jgi:hypothetical protein